MCSTCPARGPSVCLGRRAAGTCCATGRARPTCRSYVAASLESVVAVLSGADADSVSHGAGEDLAIPDLACARGGQNRLQDALYHVVVDDNLDADLGDEVHDVGRCPVHFLFSAGAAEAA